MSQPEPPAPEGILDPDVAPGDAARETASAQDPAEHDPPAQAHPLPEGAGKPVPLSLGARIGVAVIAVLALGVLFWPRGDSSFVAPGGFPVDGEGRPVPLAQRLAPVTLVHFWATWCAPCVTEIPALKELAQAFEDEPGFDLVMVAVDDEASKVEPFLGSLAPMALYDPDWDVAHRYGTRKLPETYLVVDGRVSSVPSQERLRTEPLDGKNPRWVGMTDWADPKVRAELRKVLDRRQQ